MANLMKEKGVQADAIISSPANRAYTTACHFANALGIEEPAIHKKEPIYEAYDTDVLEIIQELPNTYHTIFVFGHNPSFTSIANLFTTDYIDNVPTCGVVILESEAKSWMEFDMDNTKRQAFIYPKMYV